MPSSLYPPSCGARGYRYANCFLSIPRFEQDVLDLGVDSVQEDQTAHIALARSHLIVDLVVGTFPQTRAVECCRHSHGVLQKHVAEIGPHEMDDLFLILVRDDVLGDKDLEEVNLLPVG